MDKRSPDTESEENGDKAYDCMYKYTISKFEKVHEIEEFRILFLNIYENNLPNNEKGTFLELLFEREEKVINKDSEGYMDSFEQMYANCIEE